VASVFVGGIPGNVQLGIAATDLKSPVMFWPTPDTAGQMNVDTSSALAPWSFKPMARREP
jgi:hypothetical protein